MQNGLKLTLQSQICMHILRPKLQVKRLREMAKSIFGKVYKSEKLSEDYEQKD